MVLYFTGTGNSRYVAKCIADTLRDELADMSKWVGHESDVIVDNKRPLIFVMPVYVSAPPIACLDLLKKIEFRGNKAAYFVMTCAGGMGASPTFCQKAAVQRGLRYMGTSSVVMPQNYIVYFKTKASDENQMIVNNAKPVIAQLAETIASENVFDTPKVKWWEYASTQMILKPYYKWFITSKKFRVEDSCVSCCKCVKVCPLGNISIVDNRPQWGTHCTHCMACINLCPKDAIEYADAALGKIRYRGPEHL